MNADTQAAPDVLAEAQGVSGPLGAESADLMARLQRVSADYLNYQKRVQRDIALAREFANEELMRAFLGVLDDMERALEAARADHAPDEPLLAGMQLVHEKALDTLGKFGLKAIQAEGRSFDPEMHAALMEQPSEDHPPRTILREVRKGYQLKGRTLRPSSVIVSRRPGAGEDELRPAGGDQAGEDRQERQSSSTGQ